MDVHLLGWDHGDDDRLGEALITSPRLRTTPSTLPAAARGRTRRAPARAGKALAPAAGRRPSVRQAERGPSGRDRSATRGSPSTTFISRARPAAPGPWVRTTAARRVPEEAASREAMAHRTTLLRPTFTTPLGNRQRDLLEKADHASGETEYRNPAGKEIHSDNGVHALHTGSLNAGRGKRHELYTSP